MSELKLINRRSSNYSTPEIECLLNYLESNVTLATGYKSGSEYTTPADFQIAWDALAEQITAVGGIYGCKRTGSEVKKKWSDLKSRVKAKANKIALEMDASGGYASTELSAIEERVLALANLCDRRSEKKSDKLIQEDQLAVVKVFSFNNDSNSEDVSRQASDHGDESNDSSASETNILEALKSRSSEDKKRRISEAFANVGRNSSQKRSKLSEEDQLRQLFSSQQEISNELHTIKDILRKCQVSIEKLTILKRAELQLKCAKYGVNFDDLFD